jgi:hypothetical protein
MLARFAFCNMQISSRPTDINQLAGGAEVSSKRRRYFVREREMTMRKCITLSAGLLAAATGVAATEPVTVRNDAVLRAGPDASFSVIGHLPTGTKIEMTNCTAGWCQVEFNGIVGFVSATDLGNAGGARRSPRSAVENVQRIRTLASRRSAPAGTSTSSAPSGEGGATSKHALSPSALQPTHR